MSQNKLCLESVKIVLDGNTILSDVNLDISDGDIVSIMGSSASGKTSLIRSIAGYQSVDNGTIKIDGNIVDDSKLSIDVSKRNIGVIFQDLALFPHLTVRQNIIFGLHNHPKNYQEERSSILEAMLNITEIKDRYPHQISGGQQQRVAIARAIAPKPTILLLDEPFSALDEELKDQLMLDIKNILKKEMTTAVLITHSTKEAFYMSDKIAFISNGVIPQFDTPYNIYHKPQSKEIANFFGITSFIKGIVCGPNHVQTVVGKLFGNTEKFKLDQEVDVLIRPDDMIHDDESTESAKVINKVFSGSDFLYELQLKDKQTIYCYTPSHHNHSINENIGIRTDIDHLMLFARD